MLESKANSQVLSTDGEMPVRLVQINGIPFWQASGRTFPQVAGAEDPPPAAGKQDDPPKPKEGEGEGEGEFDKDRALATIRKLREQEKTSKTERQELEALRKRVKESEDAQKSEADKLKEQVAELQRKSDETTRELQETRNRQAIERAAVKAGAADPDDIFRLLDPAEFERDDAGKLTNADELVKALLKAKPYLGGKPSTTGVPPTPRSNGSDPTREERVKSNRDELKASPLYGPLG